MSSKDQNGEIEELGLDVNKGLALKEAMMLLVDTKEFVLVAIDYDDDPVVIAHTGPATPELLQGMRAASVFMEEEVRRVSEEFDVKRLVKLMISES
jgi:hypothetical protein